MAYLMPKLIAGHTQDNKSLVGVPTVELVHLSVVPGRCSSERRHIFNQDHFPLQRGETELLTRQQLGRQVVEPLYSTCHVLFPDGMVQRALERKKDSSAYLYSGGPMSTSQTQVQLTSSMGQV